MIDFKKPLWCSVLVTFLTTHIIGTYGQTLIQAKKKHTALRLSPDQSNYVAQLTDTIHMNELLDNILVPRVVGTKSHETVFQYISAELQRQGFSVNIDEFVAKTPIFGKLKFRNIIGTLNPKAERFLVLACHYDSKYFKDFDFIAAVDSGVPCAMMLNLAKVLKNDLEISKGNSDVSLKLIFFDGEEAFEQWGPKDSIYGAKNLASVLHKHKSTTYFGETVSELDKIDIMILLDLIGSADPVFPSYFKNTEFWYNILANVEKRLFKNGLLVRKSNNNANSYFPRIASNSYIEDDHLPFLHKGVPIIHLIPTPFPKVWHKKSDNRDNIDMNTIENLNKILRVFVARYLHLTITSQNISDTNTNHNEL